MFCINNSIPIGSTSHLNFQYFPMDIHNRQPLEYPHKLQIDPIFTEKLNSNSVLNIL